MGIMGSLWERGLKEYLAFPRRVEHLVDVMGSSWGRGLKRVSGISLQGGTPCGYYGLAVGEGSGKVFGSPPVGCDSTCVLRLCCRGGVRKRLGIPSQSRTPQGSYRLIEREGSDRVSGVPRRVGLRMGIMGSLWERSLTEYLAFVRRQECAGAAPACTARWSGYGT
jgi:hypothetical protein